MPQFYVGWGITWKDYGQVARKHHKQVKQYSRANWRTHPWNCRRCTYRISQIMAGDAGPYGNKSEWIGGVSPVTGPKENMTFIAAYEIMDPFPSHPFKCAVVNRSNTVIAFAKHQILEVTRRPPFQLIHNKFRRPSLYIPSQHYGDYVNSVLWRPKQDKMVKTMEHASFQKSNDQFLWSDW